MKPIYFARTRAGEWLFASEIRALVAHPDVSIEVGSERYDVKARVATGDERRRIWEAQKQAHPQFAEYEVRAGEREIPVVVLDRAT